jgi:two-component system sensor histidine kinase FlrB
MPGIARQAPLFRAFSAVPPAPTFANMVLAVNSTEPSQSAAALAEISADPARLAEAFRLFNQVSEELSTAYGLLERQVEALTAELAAANAETQRLREQAERNARLAAMGEMAAQLAHQLRTPLAAALLYAGNLENPELPEASRVSIAQKTVGRLKHLERLIQDMLLFARGEVLGREAFEVADLLGELAHTFEPLARTRGIEFALTDVPDGMSITGNRKALAGALTNLFENALQAVAGNPAGRVSLGVAATAEVIAFSVRDNGRGMAPDVVARLFEPFFTTRAEGTGLGLAIARGVARAHGGGIDVTSEPGVCTEFILTVSRGSADVHPSESA